MIQKYNTDNLSIDQKVELDLIELCVNQLKWTPIPAVLTAILIVAVFWMEVPRSNIIIWLSIIVVFYIFIIPSTLIFRKKSNDKIQHFYKYRKCINYAHV